MLLSEGAVTTPSYTLRITTVRPCSSAVAEIIGSALSLSRAALSWAQRLAICRSKGGTRSP